MFCDFQSGCSLSWRYGCFLKKNETVNFEGLPKQLPTVYLIVDVNEPIKILFWRFFSAIVTVEELLISVEAGAEIG